MVKFDKVEPEDIPNIREGRRGRVSYPILKSFLETDFFLARLDRTGIQQSKQSLNSSLSAYIRNHGLPIKMFTRKGEVYLMRLDINENGEPIENWEAKVDIDVNPDATPPSIDASEVKRRFDEEKGQTTK